MAVDRPEAVGTSALSPSSAPPAACKDATTPAPPGAGKDAMTPALPAAGKGTKTPFKDKARKQPTRRPDCGRKPFKAGKGDVDADSPFLYPAVKNLEKDSRRELLSFLTAITIDSVVLPCRPAHAPTVRQLASCSRREEAGAALGELLALATSDKKDAVDESNSAMVDLLRELRFVQLGLRSCLPFFKELSRLPCVLADGLLCVADAIERFVAEWQAGPEATVDYQNKWEGKGRSQADMSRAFRKAYPFAARNYEMTGTCAPSLPQCRPQRFLWQEVLSTGMCSKHYAKAHNFSPGAMTFCCGCKHPLILEFSVLNRKEAPQVLLSMLLTRFARVPRFLINDFACGAFRVALGKLGWLLMDCTVVSDRFHIFNHLCSDAFDPRSYAKMDGVDTGAPEQRNAPIRRIQTTLQGMGVVPYTNLLAYQTAILNHEAQTKWSLGVDRLPEDVDLAGEYFKRFPCSCCNEPAAAEVSGPQSDESSEGEGGRDEDEDGLSDSTLSGYGESLVIDQDGDGGSASTGMSGSDASVAASSGDSAIDEMQSESEGSVGGSISS